MKKNKMTTKTIHYTEKDVDVNEDVYQQFLDIGLHDGWNRKDKEENFVLLTFISELTGVDFKGKSCLDVGCGTGDLIPFLKEKKLENYQGIDVFIPALDIAREKFPNNDFIEADFLKYKFSKKYDFVFCSGALTTKLKSDNYEIMGSWVKKMWQLCKVGVAFNFLLKARNSYHSEGNLYLYDRLQALEVIANSVPKKVNLKTIITEAGGGSDLEEMHVFLYK